MNERAIMENPSSYLVLAFIVFNARLIRRGRVSSWGNDWSILIYFDGRFNHWRVACCAKRADKTVTIYIFCHFFYGFMLYWNDHGNVFFWMVECKAA